MPEMVTVTEAAKRLSVSHSTVSRQVGKLGVARDAAGRFDYSAYLSARSTDLNPLKARNLRDRPLFADDAEDDPQPSPGERHSHARAAGPVQTGGSGFQHAAAAEKQAKAQLAQLELGQKLGALTDAEGVRGALADAARQFRDGLLALGRELAADLVNIAEASVIRARLDAAHRRLLAEFADGLSNHGLAPAPGSAAAGDAGLDPHPAGPAAGAAAGARDAGADAAPRSGADSQPVG